MGSEANLNLQNGGSSIMLARMSPALAYHRPSAKSRHMSKEAFRSYLNHIITNVNRMLWEIKDEVIATASQAQQQEPGEITRRLLSIMLVTTISAEEHNQITRNILTSTNDAGELTVGSFNDREWRSVCLISRFIGNGTDEQRSAKIKAAMEMRMMIGKCLKRMTRDDAGWTLI